MTQYVAYLDPTEDIDLQRQAIKTRMGTLYTECVVEHIGGRRAAEADAYCLNLPLVTADDEIPASDEPPRKQTVAKKRKARANYEAVRPKLNEARLLGLETLSSIAGYLNETETPLPSGKAGKWQPAQVKRALEWLGEQE